jgi:hypothetical protein
MATIGVRRVIRKLLNRKLTEQQIWDVLSALRGPDDDTEVFKTATTEVIRWKLGFKKEIYFNTSPDSDPKVYTRKNMSASSAGYHFYSHALKAFTALGLEWDSLNK